MTVTMDGGSAAKEQTRIIVRVMCIVERRLPEEAFHYTKTGESSREGHTQTAFLAFFSVFSF